MLTPYTKHRNRTARTWSRSVLLCRTVYPTEYCLFCSYIMSCLAWKRGKKDVRA